MPVIMSSLAGLVQRSVIGMVDEASAKPLRIEVPTPAAMAGDALALAKKQPVTLAHNPSSQIMNLLREYSTLSDQEAVTAVYRVALQESDPAVLQYAAALLPNRNGGTKAFSFLKHMANIRELGREANDNALERIDRIIDIILQDDGLSNYSRSVFVDAAIQEFSKVDTPQAAVRLEISMMRKLCYDAELDCNEGALKLGIDALARNSSQEATTALTRIGESGLNVRIENERYRSVIQAIDRSNVPEQLKIDRLASLGHHGKDGWVMDYVSAYPGVEAIQAIETIAKKSRHYTKALECLEKYSGDEAIQATQNVALMSLGDEKLGWPQTRGHIIQAFNIIGEIKKSDLSVAEEADQAMKTIKNRYQSLGFRHRFDKGVNQAYERAISWI